MTKGQFLNDTHVSRFICWFRNKLSNFTHSYYNQKEKEEWRCVSFYDACDKYKWGGHNWEETNNTLEDYSKRLKESIRNRDNDACRKVCHDILQWGGVLQENKEKIEGQTDLVDYLMRAKEVITCDSLDDIIEEGIIMSSGFSKIYSLYIDDFVIYDSRVGAALCYLVKLYCKEQRCECVPPTLKFAYGASRNPKVNRNPNSDNYKFSSLYQEQGKIYIECNLKANWLLKEVLNFSECKFKDVRSLEAALFMIGYAIPKEQEQQTLKTYRNMKLAEALSLRADLQKRISQLEVRLKNNARIQEGEEPAENPLGLMDELNNNLNDLETLIFRINRTNMATSSDGISLTEMIAKKDVLALRISVLRSVAQSAMGSLERYSANEIRYVRTLNVADLQKQIDSYSKQLRELDVKIQQLNWMTELI